jgi:excisionase family DNA binding protein
MAQKGSPQLLKVAQVAERIQETPATVYRLIAAGELPAIRLGSSPRSPLRVDAGELHQFVYGQGARLHHRREQALPLPARSGEERTRAWQ